MRRLGTLPAMRGLPELPRLLKRKAPDAARVEEFLVSYLIEARDARVDQRTRSLSCAYLMPVSAHFRQVATVTHIAPAPFSVSARIQENPAILFATALAESRQAVLRQKLSR